jgi:TonB family protein
LIIFLEPNPSNKTLRISFRLGFLKNPAETKEFKEKLKELSERFKPTELSLSGTVLFVFAEAAADKLDRDTLEEVIKGVGDVSDQAFSELRKYIELDLESRRLGVGAGAPGGPGALSPSIFKTPDSPGSNAARTVDSRPVALNRVTPGYTEEARKNKVNGVVTLRMLVDETGTVKEIRVIRGLPDGLTEKAIDAGYKMRFKPAMKDGKPVAYWIAAQVTFSLR